MTFTFPITPDLIKLAKHSIDNVKWHRAPYTTELVVNPSLMLVKDCGVYVMSPFTSAGAPKSARLTRNDDTLFVIYAEGYRPEDEHVGGDDYCEMLDVAEQIVNRGEGGELKVIVTSKELRICIR